MEETGAGGQCGGRPTWAASVENRHPKTGVGGRCGRDYWAPVGEAATGGAHAVAGGASM
jgi:hypothetical protein